jgi:hypothetical protein
MWRTGGFEKTVNTKILSVILSVTWRCFSSSLLFHPSAFRLHPCSFILHPSSFILHPSSFILHPSSLLFFTRSM